MIGEIYEKYFYAYNCFYFKFSIHKSYCLLHDPWKV